MNETQKQAAITRAAALAIGEWLEQSGILAKRVHQLSLLELESMAIAAVSASVVTRSKLETEIDDSAVVSITV